MPKRKRRATAPGGRRKAPALSPRRSGNGPAVRSGWRLRNEDVERLLRTGAHAPLLEEYFGSEEYRALRDLAQEAGRLRARGGPRVLLLPGIMGSTIGRRRALLDDVIWIDPLDIVVGGLKHLALPDSGAYEALGVVLLAYLKLKLRLEVAGFDVAYHPFDWRQDIEALGKQLAKRIEKEPASSVDVVAHSMGGLVTRAALHAAPDLKIGRFIMLGTPNLGSFAPVEALRGEYSLVRKVAAVVPGQSAEELAAIFSTFPGLIQMLPAPDKVPNADLYDDKTWPTDLPRPTPAQLRRAREVKARLAPADSRFTLIAGVNQETVTGLVPAEKAFEYETSRAGDGTVPLDMALLAGARTYYVEESHGALPLNGLVGDAVVDLLGPDGTTSRLATQWTAPPVRARPPAARRQQTPPFEGRRGRELTAEDRRQALSEFVASRPSGLASPSAAAPSALAPNVPEGPEAEATVGFAHHFNQVVVGRRRQRALEIRLALGSLTEVNARAYVLGVFQGVDPAGPAAAVDQRMNGAIKDFTTRRMFSGYVGEIFAMPTGRHLLYADMLLLAGLGPVDAFDAGAQQFVGENIVRTLIRTYVDDFATVLLGAGSGQSVSRTLHNLLFGFLRGLREADLDQNLRRVTLCELDRDKFLEMKGELYRLASTGLFDDFQVTFDDVELPPPAPIQVTRAAVAADGSKVMYLIVKQEPTRQDPKTRSGDEKMALRTSLLTPTGKAAILTGVSEFPKSELDALLGQIDSPGFAFAGLKKFGQDLAKMVLTSEISTALAENKEAELVVVHDAGGSRIPWETLCVGGWFPGLSCMSRRYVADDLSVAKWMEERRTTTGLRVLLVVNPTEDLAGAEHEAAMIEKAFPRSSAIEIERVQRGEATRRNLLTAFRSGRYDVIHYAGHAQFNPEQPSLSGILCAGHEVLTGADLAGLAKLPFLVFFNACESGRVRGIKKQGRVVRGARNQEISKPEDRVRALIERNVGLAEAFMRGGAANYVGTYWPVGDGAAAAFAEVFYSRLSSGDTLGTALREGRKEVHGQKSVDWADYIHYGASDFRLKTGPGVIRERKGPPASEVANPQDRAGALAGRAPLKRAGRGRGSGPRPRARR